MSIATVKMVVSHCAEALKLLTPFSTFFQALPASFYATTLCMHLAYSGLARVSFAKRFRGDGIKSHFFVCLFLSFTGLEY